MCLCISLSLALDFKRLFISNIKGTFIDDDVFYLFLQKQKILECPSLSRHPMTKALKQLPGCAILALDVLIMYLCRQ